MLLLHISDIHFRAPHCLNPDMDPDRGVRTRLERHLQSQLSKLGQAHAALGQVDAILVGGDVAFQADPQEYGEAKKWLLRLAKETGCSEDQIFVVPGNHDIDRTTISKNVSTRNAQHAVSSATPERREGTLSAQLSDLQAGRSLLFGALCIQRFCCTLAMSDLS
jgi:predicted MPP superfamily phosphohydrolase